jgi:hypothetical protein
MNSKKVFYLNVGLLTLLGIGIILSAYFSYTLLSSESNKLVDTKLQSRILDEQQTALRQAKNNIEKFSELNEISRAIVPQDKDQAKAVREIVKIAEDSGISLLTVSFPPSTLGQLKSSANTDSSSGSSGSSSGNTTPKTTKNAVTQVKPVQGIKGVYEMEITIVQNSKVPVTYDKFISFLERLENNRRTAHVSNVSITPDTKDRNKLNFDLIVSVYIKP